MRINKKGISLIVLVITIIVLAILAATVIITITNSGLINSSKDVTSTYKLSQVRDMATVAWQEALTEYSIQIGKTDADYQEYVENYLTNAGVDITKYEIVANANKVTVSEFYGEVDVDWNAVFASATEPHPEQELEGVIALDYRGELVDMDNWTYANPLTYMGALMVTDTQSYTVTYTGAISGGKIHSRIPQYIKSTTKGDTNFKPVSTLDGTFANCTTLVVAPVIPSTVTQLSGTFDGCNKLTVVGDLPDGLIRMEGAFSNCKELESMPDIPNKVTHMNTCFRGCESLKNVSTIPGSVQYLDYAFQDCTSLVTAPKIEDGPLQMIDTFKGCTKLVTAPVLPKTVTMIGEIFSGCTKLTGTVIINSEYVVSAGEFLPVSAESILLQIPGIGTTTYNTISEIVATHYPNVTVEIFEPET